MVGGEVSQPTTHHLFADTARGGGWCSSSSVVSGLSFSPSTLDNTTLVHGGTWAKIGKVPRKQGRKQGEGSNVLISVYDEIHWGM